MRIYLLTEQTEDGGRVSRAFSERDNWAAAMQDFAEDLVDEVSVLLDRAEATGVTVALTASEGGPEIGVAYVA